MKIPAHGTKQHINPGVLENQRERVPPRISGAAGSDSTFASLLGERMKGMGMSGNRFAVPAEADVRELTVLLRQRMNERFLAVLSSYGRNGSSFSRPLMSALASWNQAGRSVYWKNLPDHAAKPVEPAEEHHVRPSRGGGRTETERFIERAISRASRKFGVDEDLVRAVIKAESNFRPESTSPKGAMGLMQLMPETASDMGVRDPYNPLENIMGGVRYLRLLMDRYEGSVDKALAAYNWGMGNLERSDGRLPRETRTYLTRVQNYYEDFRNTV